MSLLGSDGLRVFGWLESSVIVASSCNWCVQMRFFVWAKKEEDFEMLDYVNQAHEIIPLIQLLGLIIDK